MPTQNVRLVKYVFLDVVAYTKRSTEAQSYIIKALNYIVKGTINRYHISESVIYIPTGDGMCIALVNATLPYDIHVTVAKEILRRISVHNTRVRKNWRKLEVRIGINQSDDIIVKDINDRDNVAGAGVNNTRRIMDLADASQILVSSTVYESLHHHKAYLRAFSNEFTKKVKHGLILKMHQFIQKGVTGLSVDTPSSFVLKVEPEPKLTKLAAYYFAHSIKNREFIIRRRGDGQNNYALVVLLWYLARDSLGKSESTEVKPYGEWMPETRHNTLDEQFELFMELPFSVCCDLRDLVRDFKIGKENYKYFEDGWDFTIVNVEGQKKLKSDWPEIWDEFGFGEL